MSMFALHVQGLCEGSAADQMHGCRGHEAKQGFLICRLRWHDDLKKLLAATADGSAHLNVGPGLTAAVQGKLS